MQTEDLYGADLQLSCNRFERTDAAGKIEGQLRAKYDAD
jgi:hypothetical protein